MSPCITGAYSVSCDLLRIAVASYCKLHCALPQILPQLHRILPAISTSRPIRSYRGEVRFGGHPVANDSGQRHFFASQLSYGSTFMEKTA